MGSPRQEYWNGLPFPSPGDLPNPVIEPRSSTLQADSLPSELPGRPFPWEPVLNLKSESETQLCLDLCDPPWTVALKALLSMGFCRQEYWSGLPFPSPGDLPNPGIEPASLASPALASEFFFLPLSHLGSQRTLGLPAKRGLAT